MTVANSFHQFVLSGTAFSDKACQATASGHSISFETGTGSANLHTSANSIGLKPSARDAFPAPDASLNKVQKALVHFFSQKMAPLLDGLLAIDLSSVSDESHFPLGAADMKGASGKFTPIGLDDLQSVFKKANAV